MNYRAFNWILATAMFLLASSVLAADMVAPSVKIGIVPISLTGFELRVEVRNRDKQGVRIALLDNWTPIVVGHDGVIVGEDWRDASTPVIENCFPLIEPNGEYSFTIAGGVKMIDGGNISLAFGDLRGGRWVVGDRTRGFVLREELRICLVATSIGKTNKEEFNKLRLGKVPLVVPEPSQWLSVRIVKNRDGEPCLEVVEESAE